MPAGALVDRAHIQARGAANAAQCSASDLVGQILEEGAKFADYFAFSEPFTTVPSHRVLAVLRGEKEEVLSLQFDGGEDADYEAMTWAPAHPGLSRWLDLYRAAARGTGTQPDAGRHLLGWCRAAGLTDVTAGASVWCYADQAARQWWGGQWQRRARESRFHDEVLGQGLGGETDVDEVVEGWRAWTDAPDGWFVVVHGEVLARI